MLKFKKIILTSLAICVVLVIGLPSLFVESAKKLESLNNRTDLLPTFNEIVPVLRANTIISINDIETPSELIFLGLVDVATGKDLIGTNAKNLQEFLNNNDTYLGIVEIGARKFKAFLNADKHYLLSEDDILYQSNQTKILSKKIEDFKEFAIIPGSYQAVTGSLKEILNNSAIPYKASLLNTNKQTKIKVSPRWNFTKDTFLTINTVKSKKNVSREKKTLAKKSKSTVQDIFLLVSSKNYQQSPEAYDINNIDNKQRIDSSLKSSFENPLIITAQNQEEVTDKIIYRKSPPSVTASISASPSPFSTSSISASPSPSCADKCCATCIKRKINLVSEGIFANLIDIFVVDEKEHKIEDSETLLERCCSQSIDAARSDRGDDLNNQCERLPDIYAHTTCTIKETGICCKNDMPDVPEIPAYCNKDSIIVGHSGHGDADYSREVCLPLLMKICTKNKVAVDFDSSYTCSLAANAGEVVEKLKEMTKAGCRISGKLNILPVPAEGVNCSLMLDSPQLVFDTSKCKVKQTCPESRFCSPKKAGKACMSCIEPKTNKRKRIKCVPSVKSNYGGFWKPC